MFSQLVFVSRPVPGGYKLGSQFASRARRLTFALDVERDSNKDKAVVFIFIIATSGLLIWAAIKPWVERYMNVRSIPSVWDHLSFNIAPTLTTLCRNWEARHAG
jgi:hypothetical protein